MPTPAEEERLKVKVALEVLRSDGTVFMELSESIAVVRGHVAGLKIPALAAGIFAPIQPTYWRLVEFMTELARDGSEAFAGIGKTLLEAANRYEEEDHSRATAFTDVIKQFEELDGEAKA